MKKYDDLTPKEKKWLADNCYVGSSGLHEVLSMRIDVGLIVKVDEIDIPRAIFPEEYDAIIKAQHQVLNGFKKQWEKLTSESDSKK